MTFDPYAVLGVARNASAEAVKAAYRRRVRETHPDVIRSHDATEFQEVVRAFDVLSDADRRKRFDVTGEVEDQYTDRKEAIGILAGLFGNLVASASRDGLPLTAIDFVGAIATSLERATRTTQLNLTDLERRGGELLRLRGKITRINDGPNIFADKLTAQIEALDREVVDQRQQLRLLGLSHLEIGNYRNEVELVFAFQTMEHGYAAPVSGEGWSIRPTKANS